MRSHGRGNGGDWPSDRRGEGKGWQRDDKGRRYRDQEGVREYASVDERDDALAERYRWPAMCGPACCGSILACVASHQDLLVRDYLAWGERQHLHEFAEAGALHEWCVLTFGDRLYRAAFGVLMFAVRSAVAAPRPVERAPRVTPGLSDAQRLAKMNVALSKLTDGKSMPEEPTRREREERAQEIRKQADGFDPNDWRGTGA
jgi:hypothetical protein